MKLAKRDGYNCFLLAGVLTLARHSTPPWYVIGVFAGLGTSILFNAWWTQRRERQRNRGQVRALQEDLRSLYDRGLP